MADRVSTVHVSVVRPDDLLTLDVSGINLRLDAENGADPVLVVDDEAQPALFIVRFPPQTIFEQAFFEAAPPTKDPTQKFDLDEPHPPPPPTDLGPPKEPGNVQFRLGGETRLVFRVPAGARIPYTSAGLLDWSTFDLVVAPIADVPAGGAPPPPEALTIRQPADTETTLQLPFRLHLSPTHAVTWQHAVEPVTRHGRSELWHTRLAAIDDDGNAVRVDDDHTVGLRAIWSPDYRAGDPVPPPAETGLPDALAPMSVADRHQLVVLTSAFEGYAVDVVTKFVPQPVQASFVMLSPLGGWLRSFGAWDPPAMIRRSRFDHLIEIGDLLRADRFLAVEPAAEHDRAGGVDAAPVPVVPLEAQPQQELDAFPPAAARRVDAFARAKRGIDPRAYAFPLYDVNEDARLDLSQWAHVAAQGRDHYVRLVYEGKLSDTGHRASLVKVTERRFEESPSGNPAAYLRQYFYIVVKQPERVYARDGMSKRGRKMPLRRITLTTRVTPHIDYPYEPPCAITDRSFWVMVGGTDFIFHGTSEDPDGNIVDFAKPLIFVPNSETLFSTLQTVSSTVGSKLRLQARVPGQRVALADRDGTDNHSFVTDSFTLGNEGATRETFFEPTLLKADVHIPAVEALTGNTATTTIRLLQQYVDNGFGDAANATAAFAEVVKLADTKPTAAMAFVPAGANATFNAAQSGGVATPQLDVTVLTRAHGPLGGQLTAALANTFDPADVFPKGAATLFGAFDLSDLLPTGTVDGEAPKMTIDRSGTTVVTRLDWQTTVQPLTAGLVSFTPGEMTTLDVHVEIRAEPGNAGSTHVTGTLGRFDVEFLKSLVVRFTSFDFESVTGAKPHVDVELDGTTPVVFIGDLAFVEGLRKVIPPGVFGDGVSVDIIQSPLGVKAGLAIALPPAQVGVFALKNIAFSAGLTIPFLDGKPVVEFGFARRDAQFLVAVLIFGGGGFFHVELDTDGMRMLEAAFEFGATAALDIGVASGEVHIMAGIYFKMEKRQIPGDGEQLAASLSGYLRCGGSLCVLGIVRISVEFYLSFTYYGPPVDKAKGRATLTVEVEIACFSKSIELTVERSFGGNGGDPTFADQIETPALWAEYAGAFA